VGDSRSGATARDAFHGCPFDNACSATARRESETWPLPPTVDCNARKVRSTDRIQQYNNKGRFQISDFRFQKEEEPEKDLSPERRQLLKS
jgi:hypothetical protein